MGQAVANLSDICVLTSDNPRHEDPLEIMADVRPGLAAAKKVVEDADRYQALVKAVSLMQPGDALLIAGKGHETYQQVCDVKLPFSDVEAAKRAINEVKGGVKE
jgi:UDP-N-acetylmuramoyl-L-alanyl-D-glutamate--2,6-diaminopimelate ligase